MKSKILILFFFLFSILNFSQSKLLGEGSIKQKSYNEIIPFEIERGNIIIQVQIEEKIYRFLFDTGAPNLLNTDKFTNRVSAGNLMTSDSNSKGQTLSLTKVPSFKLANLTFENFYFLKYEFSKNFVFNCLNLDGIIGSNSFKNSVVKIDFQQKKLYVTDNIKNLNIRAKGNKMKLFGHQKLPFLELTMKGTNTVKEDVLFDTGYSKLYTQSNRAFATFSKEKVLENIITKKAKLSVGLFGTDQESNKSIFTIPNFQIGESNLQNVVAFTSNDENSKIGNEILKFGKLTLDFIKSKFYFETTDFKQNTNLEKNYPLFVPSYENGKLIVGMIISENLNSVLKIGDVITSIDDKKINHQDCEEVLNFQFPIEKMQINNDKNEILIKNYR